MTTKRAKKESMPEVASWRVDKMRPHPANPRTHPDDQIEALGSAFEEFGVLQFPVIDDTGMILAGEGRWRGAQAQGLAELPVIVVRGWSADKKLAFMVSDNRLAALGGFDQLKLRAAVQQLTAVKYNLTPVGYTLEAAQALLSPPTLGGLGSLAEQFGVPPFSVLNAREGWWQNRKNAWIALGIQSELGRGEGAEPGGSKQPTINPATGKICRADSKGRPIAGTDAGKGKATNATA